ncbi:MAG TPA: adenylate/guanylate cyclase domain-containing protein, partial [Candidatus Ozemobacteraceae bacterium]|nr:adenylate/guanylate cyclase domain-containing protein [Candidatus Ozemobacteraceae bacterium]
LWQVFGTLETHHEIKAKARTRQRLQQEMAVVERSHNPLFHMARWLRLDSERVLERAERQGKTPQECLETLEKHLVRQQARTAHVQWILVKDPPPPVLLRVTFRELGGSTCTISYPLSAEIFRAIGEDRFRMLDLRMQELFRRIQNSCHRVGFFPRAFWQALLTKHPSVICSWEQRVRQPVASGDRDILRGPEIHVLHRMFLRKMGFRDPMYRDQLRQDAETVISQVFPGWMRFDKLDYLFECSCAQFWPVKMHLRERLMCWFPLFEPRWLNDLSRLPPKTQGMEECETQVEQHLWGSLQFYHDPDVDRTRESLRCLMRLLATRGVCVAVLHPREDNRILMKSRAWRNGLPYDPSVLQPAQIRDIDAWMVVRTRIVLGQGFPLLLGMSWKDEQFRRETRARGFLLVGSLTAIFGLLLFLIRPFYVSLPYQLSVLFALVMAPPVIQGVITIDQLSVERQFRMYADARRELERSMDGLDKSFELGLAWPIAFVRATVASAAQNPDWLKPVPAGSPDSGFEQAMADLPWYGLTLNLAAKHVAGQLPRMAQLFVSRAEGEEYQLMGAFGIVIGSLFRQLGFEDVANKTAHQSTKDLGEGFKASEIVALLQRLLFAESFANLFFSIESLVDMSVFGRQNYFYNRFGGLQNHPWLVQTVFTEGHLKGPIFRDWMRRWGLVSVWNGRTDQPLFQRFPPFVILFAISEKPQLIECVEPAPTLLTHLSQLSTLTGLWLFDSIGLGSETRMLGVGPSRTMPRNLLYAQYRIGEEQLQESRYWHEVQRLLYLLITLPFLLALLIGRRLVEPLIELRETASRVASGDYAARLNPHRGGEFAVLARVFRDMTESLAGGKLLQLFVSESVRQSVADGSGTFHAKPREEYRLVLFVSLSGLRQHWKQMPATQILAELNVFLEAASREIRLAGGDVDKFVGEKVLAAFSARNGETREAMLVRAAGVVRTILRWGSVRTEWKAFPPSIGMIWGPLLVGRLGTEDVRLEQAMIGDTVNLASRLCDQALNAGGGCLTDDRTATLLASLLERIPDLKLERLGSARIKGKRREVEVCQLTCGEKTA